MKLPKNVVYLLLSCFVALAITIRTAYTPQSGGDTWPIFIRSMVISESGAATWVLSPLSFFGWYPYSYPSGEPILLSAVSQTAGISMETAVLMSATLFGVFGVFSIHLLVRMIRKNDFFAIISSFVFSGFFFVVTLTNNRAQTRGLFIMFYPLVIFFLIRLYVTPKKRLQTFALFLVSMIALASIHRMFVIFIVTVTIPFVFLIGFNLLRSKVNIRLSPRGTSIVLLSSLIFLFAVQVFGLGIVKLATTGYRAILPGDNPLSLTFNLGASYGIFYGIAAVAAPLGIFSLVMTRAKRSFGEKLLIAITMFSILFILDVQYFLSFFPPIMAILSALGLKNVYELTLKGHRNISISMVVTILLIGTQFFEHYVATERYASLLIGLVGVIFVTKSLIRTFKVRVRKRVVGVLLIGICLVSISNVLSSVLEVNMDHATHYPESGRLVNETATYNRGAWVAEYAQGGFIASPSSVKNELVSTSRKRNADSYLSVADNEALQYALETEFNSSKIWQASHHIVHTFEYETPSRYDPKEVQWQIMWGDEHIARMYKVNFIILPQQRIVTKYSEYEQMIPFLEDERYILYCDTVLVYHYDYFA